LNFNHLDKLGVFNRLPPSPPHPWWVGFGKPESRRVEKFKKLLGKGMAPDIEPLFCQERGKQNLLGSCVIMELTLINLAGLFVFKGPFN
jgi:hypothetical protein